MWPKGITPIGNIIPVSYSIKHKTNIIVVELNPEVNTCNLMLYCRAKFNKSERKLNLKFKIINSCQNILEMIYKCIRAYQVYGKKEKLYLRMFPQ